MLNIREFTLGKSPISVPNVARPLVGTQTMLFLERNPINIMNMGMSSIREQTALHISKLTQERTLLNVRSVGKASAHHHHDSPSKYTF